MVVGLPPWYPLVHNSCFLTNGVVSMAQLLHQNAKGHLRSCVYQRFLEGVERFQGLNGLFDIATFVISKSECTEVKLFHISYLF